MAIPGSLLFYFRLFNTVQFNIKFADDWNRTAESVANALPTEAQPQPLCCCRLFCLGNIFEARLAHFIDVNWQQNYYQNGLG